MRVLLVEDTPMWQQAVSALLATDSAFELVGVEDHFEGAVAAYARLKPDWALLDFEIRNLDPGLVKDGVAVGHALMNAGHDPARLVLVTSASPDDIPVHPFHYLPKTALAAQLLPLLHSALTASSRH
ncbi:MAG: hypothetical protein AB7P76_11080 [Candidatus Melainabacteria bacterium]